LRYLNMEPGAELSAVFGPDGGPFVTTSGDRTARVWDATWLAAFTGDRLVRAVAQTRLLGEGRLTNDELRTLRPIIGEVDPDVTSRWLAPSPDDGEIQAILARWGRHREMAWALAEQTWARRGKEVR
jgi:hypothetical protein